MFTNYIKSSFRNIIRYRLFSIINVIGFAASMSIGLLLISILNDISSYDNFNAKKKKIYRVISYNTENDKVVQLATTSVRTGRRIRETMPGVEDLTIARYGFGGDFTHEDITMSVSGLWAESTFFNVFSYGLLKGDPETALLEPFSIVLTVETAKKIFGDSESLGKTVSLKNNGFEKGNGLYTVTGILKEIPKFSHLQFDALGSFSTLDIVEKNNPEVWQWDNIWSNFVYVVLSGAREVSKLQANLNILSGEENALMNDKKVNVSLRLQSLGNIVLGKNLENDFSKRIPVLFVRILMILSGMVLLSAFFNYSNLSIARSMQRSHEVAIRKVTGAKTTQVLLQFIIEAVIISMFSLILALFIFINIQTMFFSLFPDMRELLTLNLSPVLILYFILFAMLTGIIAGTLPGLYYSKVSAIIAMKNNLSTGINLRTGMRKVLMIVQYIFALIFITSTLIFYKQYKSSVNFNLGFNTTDILNLRIQGIKPELIEKELTGIPEVTRISKSFMITSVGNNYFLYSKYDNLQDSVRAWYNIIDENYLPLFGFDIKYGRNFIAGIENPETGEVIVNEQLIKKLNIESGDSRNSVGKFLTIGKQRFQIVGIVEDFHYSTLDREIGPFIFRHSDKGFNYFNAKISSSDLSSTMGKIQTLWKAIDPVHPLKAAFYKDQIKNAYANYISMMRLVGFLAILEILIASIGLLGMVVFSTEIRLKEIGVRKVFGADVKNLVFVLSRGFLFLIIISALIALPVVYIIFEKIVLRQVAYHSPVGAFELLSATIIVLLISNLIISSQVYRISRTEPSELLRNE